MEVSERATLTGCISLGLARRPHATLSQTWRPERARLVPFSLLHHRDQRRLMLRPMAGGTPGVDQSGSAYAAG